MFLIFVATVYIESTA